MTDRAGKKAKKIRSDPGDVREPSPKEEALDRSEDLLKKDGVEEALLDIFKDVEKGFQDQEARADDTADWWDIYNCVLGRNQVYNGNSQVFVPIVRTAIEARKTRFVNQLFPVAGRYVEVTTEDGTIPYGIMALLEHYVRAAKLRTRVVPSLVRNGDVEGHRTIQVTWEETRRHVVHRVSAPPQAEGQDLESDEDVEDIKEEEIVAGAPVVMVVPDCDLLVLPQTASSLMDAIANGGSVTTLVRWSPAMLKRKIKEGVIDEDTGHDLLEELKDSQSQQVRDKAKALVDAAGIQGSARGKHVLLYRTWTMLTIEKKRRLCLAYFAGKERIASCRRNPYWSDRIDVISAPVDKLDTVFKGQSKVQVVSGQQYQANDAVNEGMDSAAYALMPIIMTDP